eukprot:TRINITY_DN2051_c0_g1_i1.p1 TRINITY_DN2051_c0_g1~~TRINITY_DN2051_c0_g1_i1.p1  ORF type:complete len:1281 (+),score=308.53 TRINITY_DN2051_c0_g1_i1:103-3945(+)
MRKMTDHLQLAILNLDAHNADAAELNLLKAISVAPHSFSAWILLSITQLQLRQFSEALRCANRAAQLRPSALEPALVVAAVKLHQHHPGEAHAVLNHHLIHWDSQSKSLGTGESLESLMASFSSLAAMEAPLAALAVAVQARALYRDEFGFWYAIALADAGSCEMLFEYANQLDEQHPNDAVAAVLRAYAANRSQLPVEQVLSLLDKAEQSDIELVTCERCRCLIRAGELSAAEKLLPPKKEWPDWPQELLWLAVLIAYKRKTQIACKDALQRLAVLRDRYPQDERFAYMRLKALFLNGDDTTMAMDEFVPQTFEYRLRKAKLAVKIALAAQDVSAAAHTRYSAEEFRAVAGTAAALVARAPTSDIESDRYDAAWRELVLVCLRDGRYKQARVIAGNAGGYRFRKFIAMSPDLEIAWKLSDTARLEAVMKQMEGVRVPVAMRAQYMTYQTAASIAQVHSRLAVIESHQYLFNKGERAELLSALTNCDRLCEDASDVDQKALFMRIGRAKYRLAIAAWTSDVRHGLQITLQQVPEYRAMLEHFRVVVKRYPQCLAARRFLIAHDDSTVNAESLPESLRCDWYAVLQQLSEAKALHDRAAIVVRLMSTIAVDMRENVSAASSATQAKRNVVSYVETVQQFLSDEICDDARLYSSSTLEPSATPLLPAAEAVVACLGSFLQIIIRQMRQYESDGSGAVKLASMISVLASLVRTVKLTPSVWNSYSVQLSLIVALIHLTISSSSAAAAEPSELRGHLEPYSSELHYFVYEWSLLCGSSQLLLSLCGSIPTLPSFQLWLDSAGIHAELAAALIVLHTVTHDSSVTTVFTHQSVSDAMVQVLHQDDVTVDLVSFSAPDRDGLHRLLVRTASGVHCYAQLSTEEGIAEYHAVQFFLQLQRVLTRDGVIAEDGLHLPRFLHIGPHVFVSAVRGTSLKNALAYVQLVEGAAQDDISPWFARQRTDEALLRWITVSRKRLRAPVEVVNFLHDDGWFAAVDNILRDVAVWTAVSWLAGVSERSSAVQFVDMTSGTYTQTALSWLLDSSAAHRPAELEECEPAASPSQPSPAVRRLLRVQRDGKATYDTALSKALRSLQSEWARVAVPLAATALQLADPKLPTWTVVTVRTTIDSTQEERAAIATVTDDDADDTNSSSTDTVPDWLMRAYRMQFEPPSSSASFTMDTMDDSSTADGVVRLDPRPETDEYLLRMLKQRRRLEKQVWRQHAEEQADGGSRDDASQDTDAKSTISSTSTAHSLLQQPVRRGMVSWARLSSRGADVWEQLLERLTR